MTSSFTIFLNLFTTVIYLYTKIVVNKLFNVETQMLRKILSHKDFSEKLVFHLQIAYKLINLATKFNYFDLKFCLDS